MFNKLFNGESCTDCLPLGVRCETSGLFNGVEAELGVTVIYVDDIPAMRTGESIPQCPAKLNSSIRGAMVEKIRKNAEILKNRIMLDTIGNN